MSDRTEIEETSMNQEIEIADTIHPLRVWHVVYTIIGASVMSVLLAGGIIWSSYELSPWRGTNAGLTVALLLMYGLIAMVVLAVIAAILLPFYLSTRKKVLAAGVQLPTKLVRPGMVTAVAISGLVVAVLVLVTWLVVD